MLYKAKTLPKYLKQQGRINRIICYKANLMVHPPKIQRPFLNLLHLCQYMGVIKKKNNRCLPKISTVDHPLYMQETVLLCDRLFYRETDMLLFFSFYSHFLIGNSGAIFYMFKELFTRERSIDEQWALTRKVLSLEVLVCYSLETSTNLNYRKYTQDLKNYHTNQNPSITKYYTSTN